MAARAVLPDGPEVRPLHSQTQSAFGVTFCFEGKSCFAWLLPTPLTHRQAIGELSANVYHEVSKYAQNHITTARLQLLGGRPVIATRMGRLRVVTGDLSVH